jgi:hypothetical protein
MQRRRVQKLCVQEMKEKEQEAERDRWFNQEWPMLEVKRTWKEKRIWKEEGSSDSGGNVEDTDTSGQMVADGNMVFQLPYEFWLPEPELAQLALGAEQAVFEKPKIVGQHMKPLYIKGHLNGKPTNKMLVHGVACVNIMPVKMFEQLGHMDDDLMKTNMMLSSFLGEASDAKGIVSMELTVGSKTVPTSFFVVNVKGKYNLLLGRDWIHANGCVPSTLHQCIILWVGDSVEVVIADDSACVASAESQGDLQDGEMKCLMGRDLSDYDFISVGEDGFIPVSVKPIIMTRLEDLNSCNGK